MRGDAYDITRVRGLYVIYWLLFLHSVATSISFPYQKQQERDRILRLPGQPRNVDFRQYSGYVTVDWTAKRAWFYWLIESIMEPDSKPLVLWLNGGPGCSSIAYGAWEEIGPFRVRRDGRSLYLSQHAWNKEANLLFLDSPAGVGFSYANASFDQTIGDHRTVKDACKFLTRWFGRFPQFKRRPFYIAGESYAGHYIPQLSKVIVESNKGVKNPIINFQGFLLGNPLIDDFYDDIGAFEFWWNHGLIGDSTYEALNKSCPNDSFLFPKDECSQALSAAFLEFGLINPYAINQKPCPELGTTLPKNLRFPRAWIYRGNDQCIVKYTKLYMNRPEVQKALHANILEISHPWVTCSDIIKESWADSPKSMLPILKELIAAGLRIWVFSGDNDAVLPLTGTRYSLKALNLKTNISWYAWYDNQKVGGWSEVYEGLTYVTVRGAGHEVPLTSPKLALALFRNFLTNQIMPSFPN